MDQVFTEFFHRGITPIITHPERHESIRQRLDQLQRWVELGCVLQITAASLTERFGRAAWEFSWEILASGLAQIVASDSHDPEDRDPRLDRARALVEKKLGSDIAEGVFTRNPQAVVSSRPIAGSTVAAPKQVKRRWYEPWWR